MISESQIKHTGKRPVSTPIEELPSPVRVFRPVLQRHPKGLFRCYALCPENSIVVEKDLPKFRYGACTGCLICVRECESRALVEEREHD